MKKSELTQLTQLIEVLVEREIKKQLPKLIGEVFSNMAGKAMVSERVVHTAAPQRVDAIAKEIEEATIPKEDPHEFKASLKELFAGVTPVTRSELEEGVVPQAPRAPRQYTKDPVLNAILNETTPDLRQRERMTGAAAFHGGYNPGVPMAAMTGAGEMMSESEMPSFARNMPTMPSGSPGNIPVGHPPALQEGQESTHAPLSAIPEGVSALDVARAGMVSAPVTQALTNFDRMRKILQASKEKRH